MQTTAQLNQAVVDLLTNHDLIVQRMVAVQDALIRYNSDKRPQPHFRKLLLLDTARDDTNPEPIQFPFNGYVVESATDDNVSVRMAINSYTKDATLQYKTLKNNDAASSDTVFRNAFIMWDAQAAKTMVIVFFLGVRFTPGSLRQVLSGGVTLTTGSGMTPQTKVSVATTATLISAADSTRKQAVIENLGSNDVYVSGTSAVTLDTGTKPGMLLGPGDQQIIDHQGDIYGIARTAATNVSLNTSS